MGRIAAFTYGVGTYAIMFLTFFYLFGFLANFMVPKGIDSGPDTPVGLAILINLGLVVLFGAPHSVMARPGFKKRWTQIIPQSVERTTYVFVATALMILLFWQWRPMPQIVWQVDVAWAQSALWSLFVLGIFILFASTFIINHFDLFGLRQVYLTLVQRPYTELEFKVTFFYRFVRHPLYVGWLLIFWATPRMSLGHLLLASGMSAYILIAIYYEERDLASAHPEYADYKERVPMLIPRLGRVHETVKERPAVGAH